MRLRATMPLVGACAMLGWASAWALPLDALPGTGPWAPSLNKFANGNQTIGTPSVRSTFTDDVALSVIDIKDGDNGSVTIRVTVQPLIIWLWIGGGVMAFGTLLAVFPGRRRNPLDAVSAPLSVEPPKKPTGVTP
jgi:cytochrome c-type biogenesis protein CcmF